MEETLELQKIAESSIQARLVSLGDLARNAPDTVAFAPMPGFEDETYESFYGFDRLGLIRLSDAIVLGLHGLILDQNSQILQEQNAGINGDWYRSYVTVSKHCDSNSAVGAVNEAVSLVSACSYCFYHWMLDSLPKVIIAETCGFTGHYIIPPSDTNSAAVETMKLLGIAEERLIPMTHSALGIKQLYIPTHLYGTDFYKNKRFFRRFRDTILFSPEIGPVPDNKHGRLYIARAESAKSRRIVNDDAVSEVLGRYGFRKLYFENLSVKDQIRLAASAEIIIGPHGSGILHSMFMPEGSTMVEFFHPGYVNYCFMRIAGLMKHSYVSICSSTEGGVSSYGYGDDILAETDVLALTLQNWERGRESSRR